MLQIDFAEEPDVSVEFSAQADMSITFELAGGGGTKPETTFEATPGAVEQTILPPAGYVFSGGVVAAIPKNYGLISYNGYSLTVS